MAYDIANHFCEYAGKCLWLLKVSRDGDKKQRSWRIQERKKDKEFKSL